LGANLTWRRSCHVATRVGEVDGWAELEGPEDPAAVAARVAQLMADLVGPARVMALEKLDEHLVILYAFRDGRVG